MLCKWYLLATGVPASSLSLDDALKLFQQLLLPVGLYDTVFDVDHDKERADAQGLEPNGFSFDGADAAGVDYALNR